MGPPAPSGKSSPLEEVRSELSSAVPESILILRIARDLILPLHFASDVDQPVPQIPVRTRAIGDTALSVPFRVRKRLNDPQTGQSFGLALAIEPSVEPDRVRLGLECDPIPKGGTCKVSLREAERNEELARIPIVQRSETIDTKLPYGFYIVEVSRDEHSLCRFTFTVEPFSLPEALEAAQDFLSHGQYIRAAAVLTDATDRYPASPDVQDLLCVVQALTATDVESFEREQAEFGTFRSGWSITREASRVFQEARSKFGERVGALIAGRTLDASAVSDAALARSTEAMVSTAVLRSLMLLKEQLEVRKSTQNEPLLRVLTVIASRQEHLGTLNGELSHRLDAIRSDVQATDDEKFALAKQLLQRYTDEIAECRIAAADYRPFFREELGEACWDWIGAEVQRVFNTAEDLYRYQEAKPKGAPLDSADFTPPVLEICRGFEDLLNDKLGGFCKSIQDAVGGDSDCKKIARREVSEDTLKEVLKAERSMSMWKVGIILRLGRSIQAARPNVFDPKLGALLAFSPGPADIEQVVFLSYIAAELRNGKVHTSEYTSPHGIRLARKLVLGLDEEQVGYGKIRGWIDASRFKKNVEVRNKLSATWVEFPGIVPIVWRALNATTTAATAA